MRHAAVRLFCARATDRIPYVSIGRWRRRPRGAPLADVLVAAYVLEQRFGGPAVPGRAPMWFVRPAGFAQLGADRRFNPLFLKGWRGSLFHAD